jgi:hypothetical protein
MWQPFLGWGDVSWSIEALLENCTYIPGSFFSFVPGILCPCTNNYICTSWRHEPVQMPSHRSSPTPSPTHPVQMPHICTGWWLQPYKCEASTFVPVGATARYKYEHICTGSCCGPVHICNGYFFFFFFPPARAPSILFLFLSPTRALPPQRHPREFLPDLRRFFHNLTRWSGVEVSYVILPS